MSIQGGVRPEKTFGRKIKSLDLSVIALFALLNSSAQVAVQQGGIRGGAGPPTSEADQGFIRRSGDQMIGALGFAPKLVTLTSSQIIDIAQDTINFTSRLIISNGGSNLLKALDGGGTNGAARFNGQIMFLQGVVTETIEIVHNSGTGDLTTGNFQTISGNNYVVQGDEIILCQFDSTDNKWLIISVGAGWSQTPATSDIDFASFDGINIDRLRFVIDSGAPALPGDPSIYLDGTGDMVLNVGPSDNWFLTQNDVVRYFFSDGNTEFISSAGVHVLELISEKNPPADLDQVGEVRFVADDDAGGLSRNTYGRYLVNADDVTSTSKEGRSSFLNMVNNVSKLWMQFNLLGNDQIDFFSDVDMNLKDIKDINDLIPQSPTGTSNIGLTVLQFGDAFIQRLQLRQSTLSTIRADGTRMIFEMPLGDSYNFVIDGNIYGALEANIFEIRSFATASTAQYNMFQDVAAGIRAIGLVEYNANRTTGGKTAYVQTFARAENISNTAFEGSYNINIAQAGALVTFMSFNFSQDGNIRAFKPLDMDGKDIILDLDGDSKFLLGVDDVLTLNLGGAVGWIATGNALDIGGKYYSLSEIANPGAPASIAGRIFLDSADNTLKVRKSSGTVSLEGGGGVTFPITPDVDVRGNVGTNQAVDISQTDGHVTTMTLTADITITFSGFPASGKQQTWEVHILQDATGGRTPTFSPAPIESVSVAKGANLLTILTFLTNNGGTDIHVVPSLRGSIALVGGAFLPLAGGTMTGNITMSNNDILGLNRFTFTDAGGEIQGAPLLMTFTLIGASIFRFITNAETVMEISGSGLTMIGTNNLIMGNNDITGINQLAFNEAGMTITDAANGITIAVPDTTDSIFLDVNARIVQFADGFVDIADNSLDITERTAPTATANQSKVYSKDVGGVTHLFTIDSDGTEHDLSLGGGVNQQLSNLAATVAINLSLVGTTDGVENLGTTTLRWGIGFLDRLDIQDDLASNPANAGITSIEADQGGMNLGVAAGDDEFDFFFGGVSELKILEDGEINFNTAGKRHKIVPTTSALQLIAELATDTVEISNSPRAFPIAEFDDFLTRFRTKSTTDTSPYELLFKFSHLAPEGLTDPNIANITWEGVNSVDTLKTYVQIQAGIDDATATTEHGFFEVFIAVNGTLNKHLDLDAASGSLRMGFFGTAAIVKPTITGSRGGNAALASLLTAGANLGLWTDSTT